MATHISRDFVDALLPLDTIWLIIRNTNHGIELIDMAPSFEEAVIQAKAHSEKPENKDKKIHVFASEYWYQTLFEEITFKIGQRFKYGDSEYLLAEAETGQVCLISTRTGRRLTKIIGVKNILKISQEEFEYMCGPDANEITLIEE